MPAGLLLFLLFLGVPILEVSIFIAAGGAVGVFPVIACVVLTALIGSWLLRQQGLGLIRKIQSETAAGRMPGRELVHGVMIAIAGALLLTPGFFTDGVGFLLFVPPFRDAVWSFLKRHIKVQTVSAGFSASGPERHRTGNPRDFDLSPEDWKDLETGSEPNPDSPWNDDQGPGRIGRPND